jgi:cell division protein FtsB
MTNLQYTLQQYTALKAENDALKAENDALRTKLAFMQPLPDLGSTYNDMQ